MIIDHDHDPIDGWMDQSEKKMISMILIRSNSVCMNRIFFVVVVVAALIRLSISKVHHLLLWKSKFNFFFIHQKKNDEDNVRLRATFVVVWSCHQWMDHHHDDDDHPRLNMCVRIIEQQKKIGLFTYSKCEQPSGTMLIYIYEY